MIAYYAILRHCAIYHRLLPHYSKNSDMLLLITVGPRYMPTFYLRFCIYAIEIMAFQRKVSFNLPMLLVSLYANSYYASQFFRSLSIAYNKDHLYFVMLFLWCYSDFKYFCNVIQIFLLWWYCGDDFIHPHFYYWF